MFCIPSMRDLPQAGPRRWETRLPAIGPFAPAQFRHQCRQAVIRNELLDEQLDLQAGLKKTILFANHDLDEVMKLGSRIAIMEGGRIIQIGTPQEIVLNPATDYVKNFVAHMNPISVLRARDIMRPTDGGTPDATRVHDADTSIKDLMRMQLDGTGDYYFSSGSVIVGKLDQADIFRALLRA